MRSTRACRQHRPHHPDRLFTVAPLWVTWLVFDFLLGILAGMGKPLLRTAARAVMPLSETLTTWLLDSDFQKLVAVLLALGALYGIGVFA